MKYRPILFSAPMVRALLAGTKTQTRRLVKSPAKNMQAAGMEVIKYRPPGDPWYKDCVWSMRGKNGVWGDYTHADFLALCPYGAPGDRLWVKETFGLHAHLDFTDWHRGSIRGEIEDDIRERFAVAYRADHYDKDHAAWRPSIFMPRWASRITLEITDVRVQRLRDISEADAIAEGVEASSPPDLLRYRDYLPEKEAIRSSWTYARDSFLSLWESINGTASLAADPWVWALTFKRVTP